MSSTASRIKSKSLVHDLDPALEFSHILVPSLLGVILALLSSFNKPNLVFAEPLPTLCPYLQALSSARLSSHPIGLWVYKTPSLRHFFLRPPATRPIPAFVIVATAIIM